MAFADEDAVAHLDLASHGDDRRAAIDFHAFETVVVVVDVLRAGRDHALVRGVVDDKIGIAADGDRAFAREQAEEFGGSGAGGVDEAVDVEIAPA